MQATSLWLYEVFPSDCSSRNKKGSQGYHKEKKIRRKQEESSEEWAAEELAFESSDLVLFSKR